jgi:hypothetical protein
MFNPYLTIVLKISKELVMFNINKFFNSFELNIRALQESERVTKSTLGFLSRDVLEALHTEGKTQGDIQYINRLLSVLTPVNRATAVLFFQAFSGHLYNEKEQCFGKKDKSLYEEKRLHAMANIANDSWNIWVWAKDHVKVEAKPLTLDKITATVKQILKKAEDNGIKKADVIKAILAGGIEADDLLAIMEAVEG